MVQLLKIGGSLINHPNHLRILIDKLCDLSRDYSLIAISGGATFADLVRYYYWELKLDEKISHKMALLCMDIYTLLIESLSKGRAKTSYSLEEALDISEKKRLSLFLTSRFLFEDKEIKSNWKFTSDSIAAYLAKKFSAEKLIIIKDVDGVYNKDPKKDREAKLIREITTKDLKSLEESCLDPYFPYIVEDSNYECYIVNGLKVQEVEAAIRGKDFLGTKIVKEKFQI